MQRRGTSMATPRVTGVAAIHLNLNPGLEVVEVYENLFKNATSGSVRGNLKRMPNLIIYNNPV